MSLDFENTSDSYIDSLTVKELELFRDHWQKKLGDALERHHITIEEGEELSLDLILRKYQPDDETLELQKQAEKIIQERKERKRKERKERKKTKK